MDFVNLRIMDFGFRLTENAKIFRGSAPDPAEGVTAPPSCLELLPHALRATVVSVASLTFWGKK